MEVMTLPMSTKRELSHSFKWMSKLGSGKLCDLPRLHTLNGAAPGLNPGIPASKAICHPPQATLPFRFPSPMVEKVQHKAQNLGQVTTAHPSLPLTNPVSDWGISIPSSYSLHQHPTNHLWRGNRTGPASSHGWSRTQESKEGHL